MKKLFTWLDINFEPYMMAILFFTITALITTQVILRFIFGSGISWAEEIARFIFVWLMYFGISYATRQHRHIGMNFITRLFSEKIQKVIYIITDLLFLLFTGTIFYTAVKVCIKTAEFNDRASSVDISMNFLYGAAAFGFVLMIIRTVQGIVWKFKHFSSSLECFEDAQGKYSITKEIHFMVKQTTINQKQIAEGDR